LSVYVSRLEYREKICEGTLALELTKPSIYHFRAGQYMEITVIEPRKRDIGGNSRTFSMASAPFEDKLTLVMRLSNSAFKEELRLLPLGSPIHISGAAGSFVLDEDPERAAVFLVGGVGLAPCRSILRQAVHDRIKRHIFLFYSNRRPEDAAYLGELFKLEKEHPNFRLIATMTRMANSESAWNGETGPINAAMLRRFLTGVKTPVYYVTGPSRFVTGMISALTALDVGEADVRIEDFGEY
jgi:ferredoxin-NADP reductase